VIFKMTPIEPDILYVEAVTTIIGTSLRDLKRDQCGYVVSAPGAANTRCCGKTTTGGKSPYCPKHSELCQPGKLVRYARFRSGPKVSR
jgi:hypothetical protein